MTTKHDKWFFGVDPDEPNEEQQALEDIMDASDDELRTYCNAHYHEDDNILFNIAQLRISAKRKRLKGFIDTAMREERLINIYYQNERGRLQQEREWQEEREDFSGVFDF